MRMGRRDGNKEQDAPSHVGPSTYDKVTRNLPCKPEMIQANGYFLFSLALIVEKNVYTILSRRITLHWCPCLN